MNELIGMLTSQLGVKEEQASGGAGMLFKLAQDQLGSGDWSKVAGALPGVTDLISKAPAADTAGSGASSLMGMAGSAMSALGVGGAAGGLGDLAKMAGAFDSLGLDMGTVMKFAPIVMEFAKKQGGEEIFSLLAKVMK